MINRQLIATGALVCFLGVAFGAFAAHALAERLQGKQGDWYDTAVQYQFIHGLGMMLCGILSTHFGKK